MGTLAKVVGRKLVGLPANGRPRTNAGWRAPGEVVMTPTGRATRWDHHPLWHHAAVTWGVVAVFVAVLVGWWSDVASTATTLRLAFGLFVAFGLWATVEKSRRYSHFREYVQPLSKMLGEKLGYRSGYPVEKITVPTEHLTDPDRRSTVRLPEKFGSDANARKRLVRAVAERLGHGSSYDGDVDMAGAEPVLWVAAQPAPPAMVGLTDMREHLEQATDDQLFLGLGRKRVPMWLSWDLDSPHLALSFGSGAGKSTLVRLLAAQTLHLGGRVVIFDIAKEGDSHGDWCRDHNGNMLPGVEMYRDAESGHDALVAWADEQRRRSGARWDRTGEDFQRTLVVLEELNSTVPILRAHWARVKEKGDPARSPAMDAILTMVCTGRAVKMNIVAVAQQLTAASLGGGAVRENFGVRVLSRFTVNTARMLVPEITPPPRSSRHKGRMTLAVDGEAFDVQGGYLTEDETIEWATSGVEQPLTMSPAVRPRTTPDTSSTRENGAGNGASVLRLPSRRVDEDEAPVSLREALEQELVGGSMDALRKAAMRPGFPEPVDEGPHGANLYRPCDLEQWAASRAKATVS